VRAPTAAGSAPNPVYTTTVAGKRYDASVRYALGQYEVAVAALPGSAVSANTLTAAENDLNARIDVLA
jgi:hypothetical protein